MRFQQSALSPQRSFSVWKISHNKIVKYLNEQEFSSNVTDTGLWTVSTSLPVKVVNDLLDSISGTNNVSSELVNISGQNDLANGYYSYSNTIINQEIVDNNKGINTSYRFNTIPPVLSDGKINIGNKILFYSSNNEIYTDYGWNLGYNFGFHTLDSNQPTMTLSGPDFVLNRKTKINGAVCAKELILKNINMDTILDSNGNYRGKKEEWLVPHITTEISPGIKVGVLPGISDNSLSILYIPKGSLNSNMKISLYVSSGESTGEASLSVGLSMIDSGIVMGDEPLYHFSSVDFTGKTPNSIQRPEVLDIPVVGTGFEYGLDYDEEEFLSYLYGSVAEGSLMLINIKRNADSSSDTLSGDLHVHGIKILYDTEKLTNG